MKQWILLVAILLIAVPLLVAASWAAYTPANPELPFPIEVGKRYGFGVTGADLTGKVVEEPRGNWLKVEVRDHGQVHVIWLNLLQVSYVQPNPPASEGCAECQGAVLSR